MAKILLAEDDASLRVVLKRTLERAGHEVFDVGQGDEALPVLAEGRFDLLVADIVMPEMDGVELARRAVAINPKIRVMFITGFSAVALQNKINTQTETKILSKPFHLNDLVRYVERMLAA